MFDLCWRTEVNDNKNNKMFFVIYVDNLLQTPTFESIDL